MNQNDLSQPRRRAFASSLAAICVAVTTIQSGCSSGSSADKYTPSSETAREALDKALTAWQRSDDPEKADSGTKPAVRMVDANRQAGQKLERFEIKSEIAGQNPARFSVRLHLDNPNEQVEANYVVVGDDPIWVFREEEYTRQQGM
jgi:hypothetical protein